MDGWMNETRTRCSRYPLFGHKVSLFPSHKRWRACDGISFSGKRGDWKTRGEGENVLHDNRLGDLVSKKYTQVRDDRVTACQFLRPQEEEGENTLLDFLYSLKGRVSYFLLSSSSRTEKRRNHRFEVASFHHQVSLELEKSFSVSIQGITHKSRKVFLPPQPFPSRDG